MAYEDFKAGIEATGNPFNKPILTKEDYELIRRTASYEDFIAGIKAAGNPFNKYIPTKEEYRIIQMSKTSDSHKIKPDTNEQNNETIPEAIAELSPPPEKTAPVTVAPTAKEPQKQDSAEINTSGRSENEKALFEIKKLASKYPEFIIIGKTANVSNVALELRTRDYDEKTGRGRKILGGNPVTCLNYIKSFLKPDVLEQDTSQQSTEADKGI